MTDADAASELRMSTTAAGGETGTGPRNEVLSSFLETKLTRLEQAHPAPADPRDPEKLDALFREILIEVNGTGIDSGA